MRTLLIASLLCLSHSIDASENIAPYFVPGLGDFTGFSIPENFQVGTSVYKLRGVDPEGKKLSYSISGPFFSVDRDSGIVKLIKELDREQLSEIETIITITDESIGGEEPNTVSLRRIIQVRDTNDNPPVFLRSYSYSARVVETTNLGQVLNVTPIVVTDSDEGINSEVTLSCFREADEDIDSACDYFSVSTVKNSEGNFSAELRLIKSVDFERRKSFVLTIIARDGPRENPLSSNATVNINVIDAQDAPPVFFNEPYTATLQENTPPNVMVLAINAADGDAGDPNDVIMTLEKEKFGYFKLLKSGNGQAQLMTTNVKIDRENPEILDNGGYYTFNVRATEAQKNLTLGDSSSSPITIVIKDVDDNIPEFNQPFFNLTIPENLELGMALPKLSIVVNDRDSSGNNRYNLTIANVENSDGVFEVFPKSSEGRTQVIIKVSDASRLDYDVGTEAERTFVFDVIATVDLLFVSKTRVEVHLEGINDNFPSFRESNYRLRVEENSDIGLRIGDDIYATDRDVGRFGRLTYILRGFGAENFGTDFENGGIFVKKALDYEQQKSYSLSLIARDGGGRESNANIFIDIIDLNDNFPQFETNEYYRNVREGSKSFEPQFFVKAYDVDGTTQGNGRISYNIESENSISGHVFSINNDSGEMVISDAGVHSSDTFDGSYELMVCAEDFGSPRLKNYTKIIIRVGSENQRPIFQGHFASNLGSSLPGPPTFRIDIPENSKPGSNLTMIQASDPDGDDRLLRYQIVDTTDSFAIDEITGLITISPYARLDRDVVNSYVITVKVIDAGVPSETSSATLKVRLSDINNKPPRFEKHSYTAYVPERNKGSEILRVRAIDSDLTSKLEYSIIEPIFATTKAGFKLDPTNFDYHSVFAIEKSSGAISLLKNLESAGLSMVTLTVKAQDVNASSDISQFDTCEVILYIQSHKESGPIFLNEGWNNFDKKIQVKLNEEMGTGESVIVLEAQDPETQEQVYDFEMEPHDGYGLFKLIEDKIVIFQRVDYEEIEQTVFVLDVKAISPFSDSFSMAQVIIQIVNINDNSPIFDREVYKASVLENIKHPERILTVRASDRDANRNENDFDLGFSQIRYSLTGPSANLFTINDKGEVQLARNQSVDREKQAVVRLTVMAEDSLGKPSEAKKSFAKITIDVLDVNDVKPKFLNRQRNGEINCVVSESAPLNTLVVNLEAYDPDEGPSGEVRYEIIDSGEIGDLLKLNAKTGELKTSKLLTGRGRSESYEIKVRATDNGNQIPKQQSLFTDQIVQIFVGDTFSNDGIPYFISSEDEEAFIVENAPIGSKVYQIRAKDPDDPTTPSGSMRYRIQNDIEDAKYFKIEALSGIITTTKVLDRETKDMFNIIVEVSDQGDPPQASARVLKINVVDVDDEEPLFVRDVNSKPIELMVLEEQSSGVILGNITAIDRDTPENGVIDYEIIDGNELELFRLVVVNSSALITASQPIDREKHERFLLTIKCFKMMSRWQRTKNSHKRVYDPEDFSEIQVRISVMDIDDHLVEFEKQSYTIGIRNTIPLNTLIFAVKANDIDSGSSPIVYDLINTTFVSLFNRRDKLKDNLSDMFELNNRTGGILLAKSVSNFVDGHFVLNIRATNNRFSDAEVFIYVVRDKSLLKFVFSRPPMEANSFLPEFAGRLQSKLNESDVVISVFDAQVLSKPDQSYDFSSTSSCFMLFRNGNSLSLQETKKIMNAEDMKNRLRETYLEFSVESVNVCSFGKEVKSQSVIMTSSSSWLVFLAFVVLIASLASTLAACCLFKKSKSHARSSLLQRERISSPDIFEDRQPVIYTEPIYTVM